MGFFDRLGLGKRTSDLLTSGYDLGISSPWSEGNLQSIVISDIFPTEVVAKMPMTRAEAIAIPAVSKARNLLISTIAKFPLRAMDGQDRFLGTQPTFLYRSASNVTPYERMAWTVDDGIFYGCSLWEVTRGADDRGRASILDAEYVPYDWWRIEDGHIKIGDRILQDSEFLLFNFPFEGLLTIASNTLRGAHDLEAAWFGRARNPIPLIELHATDECTLEEDEIKAHVASWSTARRSENGAIGYTPNGLDIRTHGDVKADLMVEGRNAVRTDVGSFLNVRAAMLDGTAGVDSLTYSTAEGEKNSFYEFDLPFWTDPIQERLSMDDVLARGNRVRFDKYAAYNPPTATGPNVED